MIVPSVSAAIGALPLVRTKAFIDGAWCDAESREVIGVRDPATPDILGTAPARRGSDTLRAATAAHEAFAGWRVLPARARCRLLLNWHQPLAVDGVMSAKFRNAGQARIAANRILVQDSIYDRSATLLVSRVRELKAGAGTEKDVDQGPLETLVCREETFGPVAALVRFQEDQEAIDVANSTRYGLAAYIYTSKLKRIWKVAERLECGMAGINTGRISNEVAPFGGTKESGLGREGSYPGIEEFLELKYLCIGDVA